MFWYNYSVRLSLVLLLFFALGLGPYAQAARRYRAAPRRPAGISTDDTLQKILFNEDRRMAKADVLVRSLSHPSAKVRKAALLALGRIGDISGLDEMARLLTRKDVSDRVDTAFALSLIPDETAAKILSQNFPMHKDPETRSALLEGIGRTGNESIVRLMAETLGTEPNSRLFPSIYEGLGLLWNRDSETWAVPPGLLSHLLRATQSHGNEATLAAFALSRFKSTTTALPVEELITAASLAPSEVARAFLARALTKVHSATAVGVLVKGAANLSSVPVRVESIKALGSQEPTPESLQALNTAFGDAYQHVVYEALIASGKLGVKAAALSGAIAGLWTKSRSTWIKGTALNTLAHIDPATARTEVLKALGSPSSPNFTDAILALGVLGQPSDVQLLTGYLGNTSLPIATAAGEALSFVDAATLAVEVQAALKLSLDRADANLTTVVAQLATQNQWQDFAPSLAATYPKLTSAEQLEAKIAVLAALGSLGDTSSAHLVLAAVSDREKLVVEAAVKSTRLLMEKVLTEGSGGVPEKEKANIEAAAKAYKGQKEKFLADRIPLNSKVEGSAPLLSAVTGATSVRVVLKTTRGEIHLKMLSVAPVTAYNFVHLVKTGFYQNKIFHRVVPNFVVQGGDPRGDGFGGPGYLIRDEVSRRKHDRGTVGIATAGKDTGGSQFFFNLAPNYHLNGRYTVFAEVTQGMAVADHLEAGDKILSARVY